MHYFLKGNTALSSWLLSIQITSFTILTLQYKLLTIYTSRLGGYPESNRERTVPHTVVLPIELYPPLKVKKLDWTPPFCAEQ